MFQISTDITGLHFRHCFVFFRFLIIFLQLGPSTVEIGADVGMGVYLSIFLFLNDVFG